MIDYLEGRVKTVTGKTVTLLVGGVGYTVVTPRSHNYSCDIEISFHTYLHWNQEKGPSFFGFESLLEKTVFLLIIECPKMGPQVAISILSSISASQFLEAITSRDEKLLSACNGIGEKKAEQLITHLHHKVAKLISQGQLPQAAREEQQNFMQWQQVSDVLRAFNYTNAEINKTISHLSEQYAGHNKTLDGLVRAALTFLSQK